MQTSFGGATVFTSSIGGKSVYLVPRHGLQHAIPPHKINYRANIAAIHQLGVENVIATSAVGSMIKKFGVGSLGILGQFIDFTRQRQGTFFDDRAVHTDMSHPYDDKLNRALLAAGRRTGMKLQKGLVYACAEGPRFETAAEIAMFRRLGADVVGMTGVPEVVLANELGLKYATVVVATNWAAGMQSRISHDEVISVMDMAGDDVKKLLEETVSKIE